MERLHELNICELSDIDYKYVITIYEDDTEIVYMEKNINSTEWQEKSRFSLPPEIDIQVCEKIIEMRKGGMLK